MQRLLRRADLDVDGVRDDVRDYVVERLGDPAGVLIDDDTGFPDEGHPLGRGAAPVLGHRRAGGKLSDRDVPRLCVRCRARVDGPGAVPPLIVDRRPPTADRNRCRATGNGDDVEFATKPVLAAHDRTRPRRERAVLLAHRRRGLRIGEVPTGPARGTRRGLRAGHPPGRRRVHPGRAAPAGPTR